MHTEYYAVVEENNELLVSNEIRTTSAGVDGKPRNSIGCLNRFSISKGKRYGNRYSSQIRFHSLVTHEKLRGRELLLDGYMTKGNTVQKLYGGKEYEIERYQGEHANEYCVYEIKNGVRDGTAELFDDGMMKMRWTMKNGVRDGSYVLLDKGVVVGEGDWVELGKEEEKVMENRQIGLRMVIRSNGMVVYEGGFNKSLERDGLGLEFENGVLKRCGEWRDNELIEWKQRFVNEKEMIEYGKGSSHDLFSHRPVYVGGYVYDETSGVVKRNGWGRVLNEWSGICEYESEWENGVEVEEKRMILNDGWYCEHTTKESTRQAITGEKRIPLPSPSNWIVLPDSLSGVIRTIRELKLRRFGFTRSRFSEFKLCGCNNLIRITIEDNCFGNARLFEIDDLSELESIEIGGKSFTRCTDEDQIMEGAPLDGVFRIANCPKLTTIQVEDWSFSDYHTFELTNLPSLCTVELGDWFAYWASSFSLSGFFRWRM